MNNSDLKLVKTALGFEMYVVKVDHTISKSIIETGFWEKTTSEFLSREAKPGMNIIEVGSHQGFHSICLAKSISGKGHLWCIDANPAMTEVFTTVVFVFSNMFQFCR